jgi:hypothetical protein
LQTGIITSVLANFIANWSMGHPEEPLDLAPNDFMASQIAKKKSKKPKKKKRKGPGWFTEDQARHEQFSDFLNAAKARGEVVTQE